MEDWESELSEKDRQFVKVYRASILRMRWTMPPIGLAISFVSGVLVYGISYTALFMGGAVGFLMSLGMFWVAVSRVPAEERILREGVKRGLHLHHREEWLRRYPS